MPSSRKLVEVFPVTRATRLDTTFIVALLVELQNRLDPLEILKDGLETAIKRYADFVRERVDAILGPGQQQVSKAVEDALAALERAQTLLAQLQAGVISIEQVSGLATAIGDIEEALSGLSFATFRPRVFTAASFAAEPWHEYWCNGASGAVIGTLPADPALGVTISVIREGANIVTIARNGKTIAGRAEDLAIEKAGYGADLTWTGSTWRVEQRMIA